MMEIKIIQINVYDNNNKYKDKQITHIPKNTVDIFNKKIDDNVNKLIEIGNFDTNYTDSYSYGGVGCGDNYCTVYENDKDCKFEIVYHYDGSSYDITININNNFEKNLEYMDIINDTKKINI